jgi:hypothetical protein
MLYCERLKNQLSATSSAAKKRAKTVDNILVHLHPDFSDELEMVLRRWNDVQSTLFFRGVRPPKELAAILLAPGALALEQTFTIGKEVRSAAGYESDSENYRFYVAVSSTMMRYFFILALASK